MSLFNRRFYFLMSLIVAALVVDGFGPRLGARLIHPPVPPGTILYIHAVVFSSWVIFFIVQTALVGVRKVKIHRTLGWWGGVLGASIPILGTATAIVVGRSDAHPTDADAAFLVFSFYDMAAFAVAFALALHWRHRPEFHRRLMFIATCGLQSAAVARILPRGSPHEWIYVGVDVLIFSGVMRDWIFARRIHPVYVRGWIPLLLCQVLVLYIEISRPQWWLTIAHGIVG